MGAKIRAAPLQSHRHGTSEAPDRTHLVGDEGDDAVTFVRHRSGLPLALATPNASGRSPPAGGLAVSPAMKRVNGRFTGG